VNGHAPEKGYFLATENRVNGYAPEKGTLERVCSGIWNVLFQFVVFSSCLIPVFRANGHEKRGFEWSTFSLILKSFYSKVGGYAPEYVGISQNATEHVSKLAKILRDTNYQLQDEVIA